MDGVKRMRLFIAAELPDSVKKEVYKSAAILGGSCLRCSPVPADSYHLTFAFLGELSDDSLPKIKNAMDACRCPISAGRIGGFGCFSDTVWRGVDLPDRVIKVQSELTEGLRGMGLEIGEREFVPHLTIARRVELKEGAELQKLSAELAATVFAVDGISLMLSERREGRQVYTRLYKKNFDAED